MVVGERRAEWDIITGNLRGKGFFLCEVAFLVNEQFKKVDKDKFLKLVFAENVSKYFGPTDETATEEFNPLYGERGTWDRLFDLYQSEDSCDQMMAFQLLVSLLERGLGDVFHSLTSEPVPHTTRDLLEKDELGRILGDNRRQLVQSLVGHPEGLNLRNILWHGFVSSDEFHGKIFLSFLFVLIFSLSKIFDEFLGGDQSQIKRRKMRCGIFEEEFSDFGLGKLCMTQEISSESVQKLLDGSYFVVRGFEKQFLKSVDYFRRGDYYGCCVLILPLLEHSLRIVYCAMNDLNERSVTAEADQLYTTIDLFYERIIESEGSVNKAVAELGKNVLIILYDYLSLTDGPRIRDLISHAELHPAYIGRIAADRVLSFFIYMMTRYPLDSKIDKFVSEDKSLQRCIHFYENYKSCYHPKNILIRAMNECYDQWYKFQTRSKLLFDLSNLEDWKYVIEKEEYMEYVPAGLSSAMKQIEAMKKMQQLLTGKSFVLFDRNFQEMVNESEEFDKKNICTPNLIQFSGDQVPKNRGSCVWDIGHLKTLHTTANALMIILALTKIVNLLSSFVSKICSSFEEMHESLLEDKADKKTKNSFYKLTNSLEVINHFIYTTLLIVEDRFKVNEVIDDHYSDYEKKQIGLKSTYRPYSFERQVKFIPAFLTGVVERASNTVAQAKFPNVAEEMFNLLKMRVPKIYNIKIE